MVVLCMMVARRYEGCRLGGSRYEGCRPGGWPGAGRRGRNGVVLVYAANPAISRFSRPLPRGVCGGRKYPG